MFNYKDKMETNIFIKQCQVGRKLNKEIYAVGLDMSVGPDGKPVFVAVEWNRWVKKTKWNEFGTVIQVVRTKEKLQKIFRVMLKRGVETITVKYIM